MQSYTVHLLNLKNSEHSLTVPSSKSLANRVLILAALSSGSFRVTGDFEAEDIQLMITALKQLGIDISRDSTGLHFQNDLSWREDSSQLELFLGNSGTCVRFLSSLVSLRAGPTVLTGKNRMKERPIADLVDSLRQFGISVDYGENEGFPPLLITPPQNLKGGEVHIKGNVSSQFITSILLSAPAFKNGVSLHIDGPLISRPYVSLTLDLLKKWGVEVQEEGTSIIVTPAALEGLDFEVEGDASAAVYWWALSFLHDVEISVSNIPEGSVQGDARFQSILRYLKKKSPCSPQGYHFDMNAMPDASLMLMALAPLLDHPTHISGIASLRVKETDRIQAMSVELSKLGVQVEVGDSWMKIDLLDLESYDFSQKIQIETYDDHRVAMSMAILGTRLGNLEILDPECVSKSYPNFWKDLESFSIEFK